MLTLANIDRCDCIFQFWLLTGNVAQGKTTYVTHSLVLLIYWQTTNFSFTSASKTLTNMNSAASADLAELRRRVILALLAQRSN